MRKLITLQFEIDTERSGDLLRHTFKNAITEAAANSMEIQPVNLKCYIETVNEPRPEPDALNITLDETGLSRVEAKVALQDGHTLTHRYFTDGESVKRVGVDYRFEDGVTLSASSFWALRTGKEWDSDWSIVSL